MAVPDSIQPLVERYTYHRDAYLRGQEKYNESQLRQDFTDPFFHALGWDVNNNKGHSEAYREVLHEEPVRIRGVTKFFDYTFRIGGSRKFIVETKKPSVRIKDDADAALQLRRYAWNAKLPLSILTNFEEWAIYDCTIKPENGDNAAKGRIEYFTFKEISEKWEYLVSIFSQDSILKGSFDKYADSQKGKKGTATVDDDILSEIESWRDALAKNIALRNDKLSVGELNMVVQRTIDRLLFLRICEDRGIEEYTTLHKLLEGEQVYARLCEIFRLADAKYNSGLFHFEKEQESGEMPDTISLSVAIDDKVLKAIIRRLYYPETPYLFSVIPPAILGHVYEQFLGKVIRLTDGHQAKVEYKPEVKKAGGVFYTPQYIVEYIVKHTVGELTKDKTPRDVAKLRVLDPACGSGSFLIGAFQFLLDWHRDWYIANLVPVFIDRKSVTDPAVLALLPEAIPRGKKHLAQAGLPIYKAGTSGDTTRTRSDWRLTTAEKKRILLNNIFGVDIDTQAVEVTKLALLLKVLEEENEENIDKQIKLFAERALPSLHENIKCGNSLIGTDILTPEMSSEEVKRINPFDWDREFADVMKAGGFDAVIGNPPYVRQEGLKEQKKYFETHYAVYLATADLYAYFFEKGISLLRPKGLFSFIVANKWMRANYGKPLRRYLLTKHIEEIIDFGDLPVFETATTYPCIIRVCQEKPSNEFRASKVESLTFSSLDEYVKENWHPINSNILNDDGWTLGDEITECLIKKISTVGKTLNDYVSGKIFFGIKTGLNDAFLIDEKLKNKLINEDLKYQPLIKPFLVGKDIKRYQPIYARQYLILLPKGWTNIQSGDIKNKWKWLKETYPAIANHLEPFTLQGENRSDKGDYWWELRTCDYYPEFEKQKIFYPDIAPKGYFTIDESASNYCANSCYFIGNNEKYLLGLLNSKLITFYYSKKSALLRGGYLRFFTQDIAKLPIRTINFADPSDKARHDRMVELVTKMLDLNKQVQDAKLEHEMTLLSRQVEATDAAIDALVYELYGLTEEEIKIVGGN
ncbi:MAG: Eco57I restriction-modification methylase domain-containing protein [Methanoregula sp.]|uniref:Eco57I restriction-modification methylase domain-containing protein n=1 Tax=Methanoregula sp. TaxID=2052170 RepID=UPI0025E436E5|nr:TaqI-like C-terminal specificity domain-containing protein [Methanoregula sp.]MCK9630365.1 Eco57I restriction-modification methylase domain-containing protein [Methanoregula sp.]